MAYAAKLGRLAGWQTGLYLEIKLLAVIAKSEHLSALKAAEQLHRLTNSREHSASANHHRKFG